VDLQNTIKLSGIKNNLILLISFTLPLNKSLMPWLIACALLFFLLEGKLKDKLNSLHNKYFYLSISLYLLYLIGSFYSSNSKNTEFELVQKLSLILLPALFFSEDSFENNFVFTIKKSFILGCILGSIICLLNAFLHYYHSRNADYFFYANFSKIMHPSYFAMYLNFACAILILERGVFKSPFFSNLTFLFFVFIIILLSSKSGVITLFFILIFKLILYAIQKKKYLKSAIISGIFILLIGSFIVSFPQSTSRLHQMYQALNSNEEGFNSTTGRISIWKNSLQIIAKISVLGVGTGDAKDEILKHYQLKNEKELYSKKLNSHNQFLQTTIAIGLPGLIVLLLILGIPLFLFYRQSDFSAVIFVLLIVFNFLFESMLETQAGVIFFSFFLFLFWKENASKEKTQLKNLSL
jgi:O-antigen ligase